MGGYHGACLALFNVGEADSTLEVDLAMLGAGSRYEIRDLWARNDLDVIERSFRQKIAPHAAKLYRLRLMP